MTQWQKIDKNIKADHKSKFRRIDFRLATTNTLSTVDSNLKASSYNALQKVKSKDEVEDEISGPIPGLLDPKLIIPILKWNGIRKIAPGFFNSGNTCYLNSTLQCLLHVPALSQYIIQDSPIPKGSNADNNRSHQRTIFDIYQHIVADVWVKQSGKTAIRPSNIVQNIKRIGKHFRPGRQEDAHEFLRLLLDSIHEDILKLKGIKSKGGGRIAETTLISRVFGGHIRNELKCNKCSYKSRTYNHILDLSIDLQGISSVKESLKAFIKPETLGKGNEWKCEKCNIKVQATKQMTISRAPNVLVLHLKRFSFGNFGGKVTKHVSFEQTLELLLSDDGGGSKAVYDLCGVVVHHGGSVHSGHYVAYVRSPGLQWYEMNDNHVSSCTLQKVLGVEAYMLFYSRCDVALPIPPLPSATPTIPLGVCRATSSNHSNPLPDLAPPSDAVKLYYDSMITRLKILYSWNLKLMRFKGKVHWLWHRSSRPNLRTMPLSDDANELAALPSPTLPSKTLKRGRVEEAEEIDEDNAVRHPTGEADDGRPAPTMVRNLINLGNRGREHGTEGFWEDVGEAEQSQLRGKDAALRALERRESESRRAKDWDRQLDQGRMKKVRGKKDETAFHSNRNLFQEKLDSNHKQKRPDLRK